MEFQFGMVGPDRKPEDQTALFEALMELTDRYNDIIRRLVGFTQEIPADLLLQADRIEMDGAQGLSEEEIRSYANGIRYASYLVACSIAAHTEHDKAMLEIEGG